MKWEWKLEAVVLAFCSTQKHTTCINKKAHEDNHNNGWKLLEFRTRSKIAARRAENLVDGDDRVFWLLVSIQVISNVLNNLWWKEKRGEIR